MVTYAMVTLILFADNTLIFLHVNNWLDVRTKAFSDLKTLKKGVIKIFFY